MNDKAEVINLKPTTDEQYKKKRIQLDSGCQILINSSEGEESIEIAGAEGEVMVNVRMTDEGPVISVHGTHLELKSTDTIALEAKKIKIEAEEETVVGSKGDLRIDASEKLNVHSDDDIRVVGKMIYLN